MGPKTLFQLLRSYIRLVTSTAVATRRFLQAVLDYNLGGHQKLFRQTLTDVEVGA